MRCFLLLGLAGLLLANHAGPAAAQSSVYTRASLPSADELAAVRLRTQWSTAIPLLNRTDGVGMMQIVSGNQLIVQTKSGLLIAYDATTGVHQWSVRYLTQYAPLRAVAVNDKYVFALNLLRLYVINRYTGLSELEYTLPLAPAAAPAADNTTVYIVMSGQRLAAFELPRAIAMPDKSLAALERNKAGVGNSDIRARNPADVVADRYPGPGRRQVQRDVDFDRQSTELGTGNSLGGSESLQRSPSLAVVGSVLPPYRVFDRSGRYVTKFESLSTVSSLRQPYSLYDPSFGQHQRTPSVAAIPPSVAAVYELSNLRPRGIEPSLRWILGSSSPIRYQPLVTKQRIWMFTDSSNVSAFTIEDKIPQVRSQMPSLPTANASQSLDVGYVPLQDGNLLAIDLTAGGGSAYKQLWRANVGGLMDQSPIPTLSGIYQGGENAGVARIDNNTGVVVWRTPSTVDHLLAVNDDRAYVRDHQGLVHVFDRNRVIDAQSKQAVPIANLNLQSFAIAPSNHQTDRIYLASDNGLLICLRDQLPKYAFPQQISGPLHALPADAGKPKPGVSAVPK